MIDSIFANKMTNEIKISLYIEPLTPNTFQSVTDALNLEPTEAVRKGAPYPNPSKARRLAKDDYWKYTETMTSTDDPEAALEDFVQRIIRPRMNPISLISSEGYCEMSVAYYFRGPNPGFHLSENFMATLSDGHINLDIDIYCLPDGDE